MATQRIKLDVSKFEWMKVFEANRDMDGPHGAWKDDGSDGHYTATCYLDEDNFRELEETNSLKAKGKFADEDGLFKVRFDRKHKDRFEWASGAPNVSGVPEGSVIGNGSSGTVEITVYTTSVPGRVGSRLESVEVKNLVDYVPEPKGDDPSDGMPF